MAINPPAKRNAAAVDSNPPEVPRPKSRYREMIRLRRPPTVEFPFHVMAKETMPSIANRRVRRLRFKFPLRIPSEKDCSGPRRRKIPARSIRMEETDSSSRLVVNLPSPW